MYSLDRLGGGVWGGGCYCYCGVHLDIQSTQTLFAFACRSLQRKQWVLLSLSTDKDPDCSAPIQKAQMNCQNWTSLMARRMPSSWRCVSKKKCDSCIYMLWSGNVTVCCDFYRLMILMLWRTSTPSWLMFLPPMVCSPFTSHLLQ